MNQSLAPPSTQDAIRRAFVEFRASVKKNDDPELSIDLWAKLNAIQPNRLPAGIFGHVAKSSNTKLFETLLNHQAITPDHLLTAGNEAIAGSRWLHLDMLLTKDKSSAFYRDMLNVAIDQDSPRAFSLILTKNCGDITRTLLYAERRLHGRAYVEEILKNLSTNSKLSIHPKNCLAFLWRSMTGLRESIPSYDESSCEHLQNRENLARFVLSKVNIVDQLSERLSQADQPNAKFVLSLLDPPQWEQALLKHPELSGWPEAAAHLAKQSKDNLLDAVGNPNLATSAPKKM